MYGECYSLNGYLLPGLLPLTTPPPFVCDSGLISSARESGVLSVTVDILQTGNEFACRSKQLVGPNPATMLEVGGCLAR